MFCSEEVSVWRIWNCKHDWIASRSICNKSHAAAKTALRDSLDAAKRAVPHLIAHKVISTIANAAKKRKRVDINVKHSQEPQSKKASVDTWYSYKRSNRLIWYCIGLTR